MIATTQSHIEKTKAQHRHSTELILALMDLTVEQFNEFQYYAGVNYANYITGGDEMGLDLLISTKYYWSWWRNEWAKRDELFLEQHADKSNMRLLHEEYNYSNYEGLTIGKTGELMVKMGASVMGYAIDEKMKGVIKCTK